MEKSDPPHASILESRFRSFLMASVVTVGIILICKNWHALSAIFEMIQGGLTH